ncbi:MAG: HIT family protein [Lachnospiraceae bacterium]|nr:HIT family protein [Lachnospiraceae bacterium]
MEDCIFCKIANGVFGSATVYEDDDFRAVLDIAPAAKGHVLILPKKHMADLLAIEPDVAEKALKLASRIAKAQKKALGCDGINMLQNSGEAAWQSVFHLHIHLIPRYKNDGVIIPWKTLSYADGEADEYAARIRAEIE